MKDSGDKARKKVLMIAYSFPPMGGGRVRRSLKFAKYLSEFGWEPVVLTVKKPYALEYDYGLLDEIKDKVKIVRTSSFELPSVTNYFKGFKANFSEKQTFIKKLKSFFYRGLNKLKWCVFFPDSRIGWVPFCVLRGIRLIKKEGIGAIYVSGEPFSCFIAGVILKKITRLPLVLDYRDEWVGFSKYYFPEKPGIIEKLELFTEKAIIKNADKVISVTKPIIDSFINRYHYIDKNKFEVVTNGFDPEDFKGLSIKGPEGKKFIICYSGILYRRRSPEYFLKAAERLSEARPDFLENSRIRFIGNNNPEAVELLNRQVKLKGVIELPGFLPYKQALELLMESSLLLYIEDQAPDSNRVLPAKLFQYMASRRPVIALSNGGPVKEVVEYTGCGKVVPSFDVEKIAEYLDYFYSRFKKTGESACIADEARVMEFSRKSLSGKLARILEETLVNE